MVPLPDRCADPHNVAAYGDLELRGVDDRWSRGADDRVEHVDDATSGKLSFPASAPGSALPHDGLAERPQPRRRPSTFRTAGPAQRMRTNREHRAPRCRWSVENKVEAAYARSDLFVRRQRLMDDWAACLEEVRGQVVVLRR